jgi:hypothetical protein
MPFSRPDSGTCTQVRAEVHEVGEAPRADAASCCATVLPEFGV